MPRAGQAQGANGARLEPAKTVSDRWTVLCTKPDDTHKQQTQGHSGRELLKGQSGLSLQGVPRLGNAVLWGGGKRSQHTQGTGACAGQDGRGVGDESQTPSTRGVTMGMR